MDHLVQFTISIDDKHIAQMVESKAAKAMEDEVLKVCKSQIGCEANYWGSGEPGPALKRKSEDRADHKTDHDPHDQAGFRIFFHNPFQCIHVSFPLSFFLSE